MAARGAHGGRRRLESYAWERLLAAILAGVLLALPLHALGEGTPDAGGNAPVVDVAVAATSPDAVGLDAVPNGSDGVVGVDSEEPEVPFAEVVSPGEGTVASVADATSESVGSGEQGEPGDAIPASREDVLAPVGETPAGETPEGDSSEDSVGETAAAQEPAGDGAIARDVTSEDASGKDPASGPQGSSMADVAPAPAGSTAGAAPESAPAESSAPAPAPVAASPASPPAQVAATSGKSTHATASPASYRPTLDPVAGVIPLLVVVAGFLGENGVGAVSYSDAYDWAQTVFGSANGVSAYYSDMSNGKFTFTPAAENSAYGVAGNTNAADAANDGVVHVSMPEAHGNWGDSYYSDAGAAGEMLAAFARILKAADAFVDFAAYDADGNGVLDRTELAVAIVVAGYEAAEDEGDLPAGAHTLWSHAWSYTDAGVARPAVDGVKLDDYIAIAEKTRDASGPQVVDVQEPLAVLTHELGHYLGLPDLYDTTDDSGDWTGHAVESASLMATGNWAATIDEAGKATSVPAALDAWSRYQLGWVKPTVVKKGGVYTVSAQDSKNGYVCLLVPTKNKGEYYLIENRTFAGHDAGLAYEYDDYANGGLVIWHVDNGVVKRYLASNTVNGSAHRPGVAPLYPEQDESGWDYTLWYGASVPDTALLYWGADMFGELFPCSRVLDLPLYGAGADADDPLARLLSGIRIEFLDNAGPDMRIRIWMPGEDGPQVPEEEGYPNDWAETPRPKTETYVIQRAEAPAAQVAAPAPSAAPAIPATGDDAPRQAAFAFSLMLASLAAFAFARARRADPALRARHAR